jgi:hypothetical protein
VRKGEAGSLPAVEVDVVHLVSHSGGLEGIADVTGVQSREVRTVASKDF